jgi:hypothetical protein
MLLGNLRSLQNEIQGRGQKSKRKTGKRSDDNGVREARDDGVDLFIAPRMARDGVVWRGGGRRLNFEP